MNASYLLAIPKSYKPYHIMSRVVSVISDELPEVVPGFKLVPVHLSEIGHPDQPVPKRGRGAAIVTFKATWDKEFVPKRKEVDKHYTKESLPDWAKHPQTDSKASAEQIAKSKRLLNQLKDQQKK